MPSPRASLPPELQALREQFEHIAAEARALVEPLSDEQFNWRPPSGGWSIGLCLEHLNATARWYLPQMDEGIAEAMQSGRYGEGPYAYNWFERWIVRRTEPPPWPRLTAPQAVVPAVGRKRSDVMAAFGAYQVQYVDRLRQANGVHLARAGVRSPAFRLLRIALGTAFLLMAAHERRHLWQAREVMRQPGFPMADRGMRISD